VTVRSSDYNAGKGARENCARYYVKSLANNGCVRLQEVKEGVGTASWGAIRFEIEVCQAASGPARERRHAGRVAQPQTALAYGGRVDGIYLRDHSIFTVAG
jgi:hypothetical protein